MINDKKREILINYFLHYANNEINEYTWSEMVLNNEDVPMIYNFDDIDMDTFVEYLEERYEDLSQIMFYLMERSELGKFNLKDKYFGFDKNDDVFTFNDFFYDPQNAELLVDYLLKNERIDLILDCKDGIYFVKYIAELITKTLGRDKEFKKSLMEYLCDYDPQEIYNLNWDEVVNEIENE